MQIRGVTQDGQRAVEYLSKLTEINNSSGLTFCEPKYIFYELGEIYEEGCGSVAPDIKKAIEFYQKAADRGNYFAKGKLDALQQF